MSKKVNPKLITYKTKHNFEGVVWDFYNDGFQHEEFDAECNGEVSSFEYATAIKCEFVYLCIDLGKYFVFYRG